MKSQQQIQSDIEFYRHLKPQLKFYQLALLLVKSYNEFYLREQLEAIELQISKIKPRVGSDAAKFNDGTADTARQMRDLSAKKKVLDHILN